MAMQRKSIKVVAALASIVIAITLGISFGSVLAQQTTEPAKFQTLKIASLSVRHAYPDENPNGTFATVSSEIALKNPKLQQAIDEAEKRWKMNEQFCSNKNCALMNLRAIELTYETEISQPEMTSLASEVSFAHSEQVIESDEVMTKFDQVFVNYDNNSYVVVMRSAWN